MDHICADAIERSRTPLSGTTLARLGPPEGPVSRLAVVPVATSTNTELLETLPVDPEPWPHMSAYVADHQSAGRGRSGRTWETPAGAALTATFVLRPHAVGRQAWGWAPLVVGLAVVRTLRDVGVDAWLKWPNDVIVASGADDVPGWGRWRKLVGILCEGVPGQDALVAGVGINVSQLATELPVEHAASLATAGATTLDRAAILESLATHLSAAVDAWTGDGDGNAVARDIAAVCATIGTDVTVDVPSGTPISGRVESLAPDGGLVLVTRSGARQVVHAGDVRVRRA